MPVIDITVPFALYLIKQIYILIFAANVLSNIANILELKKDLFTIVASSYINTLLYYEIYSKLYAIQLVLYYNELSDL
jgi:hypothetical protein